MNDINSEIIPKRVNNSFTRNSLMLSTNEQRSTNKLSGRLLLSFEILQTIFSIFVIIIQLRIAVSINRDSDNLLLTDNYIYMINSIVNYQIINDIKIENSTSQKCSFDNYYAYNFRTINGVGHTCITSQDNIQVLSFDKGCNNTCPYNSSVLLTNIGLNQNMCYRIFPKRSYKYTFQSRNGSCSDSQLGCGFLNKSIICLDITSNVKKCPITEIKFFKDVTEIEAGYYKLSNISGINQILTFANISTPSNPYVSFQLKYETINDVSYYDYMNKYGSYLFNGSSYDTFNNYTSNFDKSDNNLDLNPYYKGKQSEFVKSQFNVSIKDFFAWNNITQSSSLILMSSAIDQQNVITMKSSMFSFPSDKCINDFFLDPSNPNAANNNNRGLFAVLSDVSFEFLNLNSLFFITWNFIQIGIFFIYSFIYRFKILSDKINQVMREMDAKSEITTIITLKMFYYLSLCMKLVIFYNANSYTSGKIDFIKKLVNNECFASYDNNNYGDKTLLHIHLTHFLQEPMLDRLIKQFSFVSTLTLFEIGNEVISLTFIWLKLFY